MIKLGRNEYRDKVYGCWMGKNIGGTLGAPFECRTWVNCLSFYHKLPGEAAANDDLDLQLVWLKMMEDRGVNPGLSDFADTGKNALPPIPGTNMVSATGTWQGACGRRFRDVSRTIS